MVMRVLCDAGTSLERKAPSLNKFLTGFPEPKGTDCFLRVEPDVDGFTLVFVAKNPGRSLASFSERVPWGGAEKPVWQRALKEFLETNASKASQMGAKE